MNKTSNKPLPSWVDEKIEFCDDIRRRPATLKIVLKTKDEPERLISWITHHSSIVGLENLIIFDNMSTDDAVQRIYDEFIGHIPIIRYGTFHNLIHHMTYFGEIYAALRQSCHFFTFLDTDEHLTLYSGDGYFYANELIPEFLRSNSKVSVFPGTWLPNQRGYNDRFELRKDGWPLVGGLQWGKPVISSAAPVDGIVHHNTELNHECYREALVTNLFVLHRSNASAGERIRINIQKMISYGALRRGDGIAEAMALDPDEMPAGNPKTYCLEIRKYVAEDDEKAPPADGSFVIQGDGLALWNHGWQEALLTSFIHEPHRFSCGLFSPR